MEPMLLPNIHDYHKIDVYESHDGYQMLRKALGMKPEAVTDEVVAEFLRSRAGFCGCCRRNISESVNTDISP